MKTLRFLILSMVVGCLGVGCADHLQPSTPGLGAAPDQVQALQGAGLGTIHRYEVGTEPAIALASNGVAIEVHMSLEDAVNSTSLGHKYKTLNYRITATDAILNASNVASHTIGRDSFFANEASAGRDPSVAINVDSQGKNQYVIVYSDDMGLLHTVVGNVDANGTNAIGKDSFISKGTAFNSLATYGGSPSIAFLSPNRVIVVFEDVNDLGYLTGTLNNSQGIDWDSAVPVIYDRGDDPSISINSKGQVVEVHKSPEYNTLWMRIGQVSTGGNAVEWLNFVGQYTTGKEPNIYIDDDGTVVEMHTSETENYIFRIGGYIENNQFYNQFNQKLAPAVTSASVLKNGRLLTVLGNGDSDNPQLFYSVIDL